MTKAELKKARVAMRACVDSDMRSDWFQNYGIDVMEYAETAYAEITARKKPPRPISKGSKS